MASTDAKNEAAVRQNVNRGGVGRKLQRIANPCVAHVGPEPQRGCHRHRRRQSRERRTGYAGVIACVESIEPAALSAARELQQSVSIRVDPGLDTERDWDAHERILPGRAGQCGSYDVRELRTAPSLTLRMVMMDLPACNHSAGFADWLRASLGPYVDFGAETVEEAPLSHLLEEVPVILDPPDAACVWSGRLGSAACWELLVGDFITARAASVARTDGVIPQEIVRRHPQSYHQTGIGAGPGFLDRHPRSYDENILRHGPHFNGYILGDDLLGYVNVGRGARFFLLAAQFPGASVVDYDGYWDGEALLARLHIAGPQNTS